MHMFFALRAGLDRLFAEGLDGIFARHARLAEATRRCVEAWSRGNGPSLFARDRATCSDSVTAVRMPDGFDANAFRAQVHQESRVALDTPGQYVIVPKGIWHTANIADSAQMFFVTPGEGTENKAR